MNGKVVLITGGGSGIGRATAMAFAKKGAIVAVSDISVSGGEETIQMIKSDCSQAIFIKCDVSNSGEVQAMINEVILKYGHLDYAFNNAGIEGPIAFTAEYPESDWHRMIGIHLTGVWLCMKYEIPHMVKQGHGAIVNTSSAAGVIGAPGASAYVAAKHGIIGLTKTAALEYGKNGIRVNAVLPGPIRTPMYERIVKIHPEWEPQWYLTNALGRIASASELADAVVMLCSESSSFITGHSLLVDGGLTAF